MDIRDRVTHWLSAVLLIGLLGTQSANSQTFTVLHTFTGTDGESPYGGLIVDKSGNLYGTTFGGGAYSSGIAFRLNSLGVETASFSFDQADGAEPHANLVTAGAAVYGTTFSGGTCCGVVFKVDQAGEETVLYEFTGGTDGGYPVGRLMLSGDGDIYGTTAYGGISNCSFNGFSGCGTVFRLDKGGKEAVLYSFAGGGDGANPVAGLVQDEDGNLYGTTYNGGAFGHGTVFKVDTVGGETLLHSFCSTLSCEDGSNPDASLVPDGKGSIYGTTAYGGIFNGGTVFKVDRRGTQVVLHAFCSEQPDCADGLSPAGLIFDSDGNAYGTTFFGGGGTFCNSGNGCGVVFKLDEIGTETVLYTFAGAKDGAYPQPTLVLDGAGNLNGTAASGGDANCDAGLGCGTVFEVTTQ